jgi:acetylornithine deacetylase
MRHDETAGRNSTGHLVIDPQELLAQMIAIDSVNDLLSHRTNSEAPLLAYLEKMCRDSGLATERLPVDETGACNLLVRCEVSPDSPWLLFESHLDAVGVEGMSIEPFVAKIEEGRMYGRGACDTKGSGAAMLAALDRYARLVQTPNNIALLFTVDEEQTKRGIHAFASRQLAHTGFRPIGAIIGEPTSLRLVTAHCGVARFAIRTHGVAAHSSNPALGRSAIRAMVRVIDALETRYISRLSASHPLTGPARCSINMIRGGTAVNIVPEECEIWLDRRVVPGEDPATVIGDVRRVLDEVRSEQGDLLYSIIDPRTDPPLDPSGGERFVESVRGVLRSLGKPDAPVGAGFGSDASTISEAGIPAVLLGPGSIEQAHREVEYVDLAELDDAVEIYGAIMRSRPDVRGRS